MSQSCCVDDKVHYQPIHFVYTFPTKYHRHGSTTDPKPISIDAPPHPLDHPAVQPNNEYAVEHTSRRKPRRPNKAEESITHRHIIPNIVDVFFIPLPQPHCEVGIRYDCDDISHYSANVADKSYSILLLLSTAFFHGVLLLPKMTMEKEMMSRASCWLWLLVFLPFIYNTHATHMTTCCFMLHAVIFHFFANEKRGRAREAGVWSVAKFVKQNEAQVLPRLSLCEVEPFPFNYCSPFISINPYSLFVEE
jgi:hypothetical protein